MKATEQDLIKKVAVPSSRYYIFEYFNLVGAIQYRTPVVKRGWPEHIVPLDFILVPKPLSRSFATSIVLFSLPFSPV